MKTREQLNEENYQRAQKLANLYDDELKAEYLAESANRYQFEQQQAVKNTQIFTQTRPLVAVLITLLIVAISAGLYWKTDRFNIVQAGQQLHKEFQHKAQTENSIEKNDHYIVSLQNRLRENPNNGDLWYELGQAYSLNNDFSSALVCYHNAEKVLGSTPAILGAMATVDYYQNKQKLTDQAKAWITQALAKDPKESSSLLLLASDSFLNNNYAQAIENWRKVLDSDNESIDRPAIIQSIDMARQMMNGRAK